MNQRLHCLVSLAVAFLLASPALAGRPSGTFQGGSPRPASASASGKRDMSPLKIKGGPEIWGVVEYARSWEELPEEDRPFGVYSFLASNPSEQKMLVNLAYTTPNAGGVFIGDEFKFINYTIMYETAVIPYFYRYDTTTWEQVGYPQYMTDTSVIGMDLAYDQTTGNTYGYFYNPLNNEEPNRFGIITYNEYGASVQTIARDETNIIALAADADGQLYGIADDGAFYKINKQNGDKTLVDYTGVMPSTFRQSMTFDPATGKLYWACFRIDYSSALYEINLSNGTARLISEIEDDKEISCLHIPAPRAADDAPAVPSLAVNFPDGTLKGSFSVTLPSETYGGDPLTGDLSIKVYADDTLVAEGTGKAGATVNIDAELSEGLHSFYVSASNDAGESPKSEKSTLFIGFDKPIFSDEAVRLSYDKETSKTLLEWDMPEKTLYGGYLDVNNVVFDVVRYPGEVTVATGLWLPQFSETLTTDGLASYYYTVTARNHNNLSDPAASNRINVGEAFDVPFIDDFTGSDYYGLYSIVDSNEDDLHWNEGYNCFSIFFSFANPLDDWLIAPPVRLKKGNTYSFTFDIRSGSSYDTETFEVGCGSSDDPASYTILMEPTDLKSSNKKRYTVDFIPEEDGIYHFGIHAVSKAYQSGMYVSYVAIESQLIPDSPEAVKDLAVVPADNGLASASVSFKAPEKNRAGKKLESISSIVLLRDGNEIKTFQAPALGASLSFTDTDVPDGFHDYTIVPYNSFGRGEESTVREYVGMDIPAALANVKLTETSEGVILTWDPAASEGINGRFVNPEEVTYKVTNNIGDEVASIKGSCEWEYAVNTDRQTDILFYNVTPASVAGNGEASTSNYIVTGHPHPLPLEESFAYGEAHNGLWWTYGSNPINGFSNTVEQASDNDWGSMKWYAINDGEHAYLCTGKISAKDTANPMLFFDYYFQPGTPIRFEVIADPGQKGDMVLAVFDASSEEGEAEWRSAAVEFPKEVAEADYFILRFRAEGDRLIGPNYQANTLYLDNMSLRDVPDVDVALDVNQPGAGYQGEPFEAIACISNLGKDLDEVKVTLFIDDVEADSSTVAVAMNAKEEVVLAYNVPFGCESFKTRVVAEAAGDVNTVNNSSMESTIPVAVPSLPAATDLKAELDGATSLTWTAPDGKNRRKDTFDSYRPWSRNGNVGNWSLFDGDDVVTNVYTGMDYPGIGEKLSFMVFNNEYAVMDDSQVDIFTPLSGSQCMLAVANLHEYGKGIECSDWLISPELSGAAQTIEFDIKSLTDYEEDFAIYISSESADPEVLKQNKLVFEKFGAGNQWRHYEYELPEGTRYFAIVYTSNLSGVMVDDVICELPCPAITGYEIYRDGEKIADLDETSTSYIDNSSVAEGRAYGVIAKYGDARSGMSNIAISGSGMESLINSREIGEIYSLDGVYLGSGRETLSRLAPGIYVSGGTKLIKH